MKLPAEPFWDQQWNSVRIRCNGISSWTNRLPGPVSAGGLQVEQLDETSSAIQRGRCTKLLSAHTTNPVAAPKPIRPVHITPLPWFIHTCSGSIFSLTTISSFAMSAACASRLSFAAFLRGFDQCLTHFAPRICAVFLMLVDRDQRVLRRLGSRCCDFDGPDIEHFLSFLGHDR